MKCKFPRKFTKNWKNSYTDFLGGTVTETQKIFGFLGLCRKAGKLCCGHDAVKESLQKRKAALVIFTGDASERLKEEIKALCKCDIICVPFGKDELFLATGKKSVIYSVIDEGFSNKLKLMFGEE